MTDPWRVLGSPADFTGMDDQEDLLELLDTPETPEEKAAMDALAKDPEQVLAEASARLETQKGGTREGAANDRTCSL